RQHADAFLREGPIGREMGEFGAEERRLATSGGRLNVTIVPMIEKRSARLARKVAAHPFAEASKIDVGDWPWCYPPTHGRPLLLRIGVDDLWRAQWLPRDSLGVGP